MENKEVQEALYELLIQTDKENVYQDEINGLVNMIQSYVEQLEQALDKACEVIDDITKGNGTEFCPATKLDWLPSNCNEHTCENGTKECWKEWCKEDAE